MPDKVGTILLNKSISAFGNMFFNKGAISRLPDIIPKRINLSFEVFIRNLETKLE